VTTKLTLSFEFEPSGDEPEDRRLLDLPPGVLFVFVFAFVFVFEFEFEDSPVGRRSSRTSEGRLRAFFSKKANRFHLDDAMVDCNRADETSRDDGS